MPKRQDIQSILIIGAGPIVIGQACEFDYSGAQAVQALKQEGYRVILVNSNPATIMTDPGLADATYIEPITPASVAKIIEKEKPDALLPTMGGQTALNTGLALFEDGTLAKFGVEMIGANAEAIKKGEDRLRFRETMDAIGLASPASMLVTNLTQAQEALDKVGLPTILRPSRTMGGEGGGICYTHEEFLSLLKTALQLSPISEVLVEQSVLGWKEYEMEVVRDKKDNCIIVCTIENIDPMGIHTGDSVTVAPALTLTDKEYQIMRNASLAVLRAIGVETGGSNVQYAVNPDNGQLVVIEMNPRVSRSSALASKATGFPIAKVAAKLAVGYTLDELDNDITKVTPASFEPTIDYVVTKMPRFTFEKFKGAEAILSTSMKSVGEAMAIGTNFAMSLQKALRSMETGLDGLNEYTIEGAIRTDGSLDKERIMAELSLQKPNRLLIAAQAYRYGLSEDEIFSATKIDRWFLRQIKALLEQEERVRAQGLPQNATHWQELKQQGFSDARLGMLCGLPEKAVRDARLGFGIKAVYKRIDTCAAEIPSSTSYMYGSYTGDGVNPSFCETEPSDKRKVIILGGGPNRIGQGIEFDYCCVHAAYALKEAGYETIMVNCNPETVSTDYDTSDRLYFEPLTGEDVLAIVRKEQEAGTLVGVIVQLGGQTPLKLAHTLAEEGIPILGTAPDAIDLAEDREHFQKLLQDLNLKQPANALATTEEGVCAAAEEIGYPVLLRPSYVLGGRGMEIVTSRSHLERYVSEAVKVSGDQPVLIDSYLRDAIEVDLDALCDGETVKVMGVMEHIEEAGVHSGDSACSLPPHSLSDDFIDALKEQATKLALALKVRGLMNVQFAVKDTQIYVLEVNPRASRTVPFVAKATGVPVAKIAARLMVGEKLSSFDLAPTITGRMAVKEAVFPFDRFPGADVVLGPEMRSTGEVMGHGRSFARAFLRAQLGAGVKLPKTGKVFITVRDYDKRRAITIGKELIKLEYEIVATEGTKQALEDAGVDCTLIARLSDKDTNIIDAIHAGKVAILINTAEGEETIRNAQTIRAAAIKNKVPYYTTIAGASALVQALGDYKGDDLDANALQSLGAV